MWHYDLRIDCFVRRPDGATVSAKDITRWWKKITDAQLNEFVQPYERGGVFFYAFLYGAGDEKLGKILAPGKSQKQSWKPDLAWPGRDSCL